MKFPRCGYSTTYPEIFFRENLPRHQFHKGAWEHDTSFGIKNRAVIISNKISGNNLVLSIIQKSFHGTISSFLHFSTDLFISGLLVQTNSQINNRHISCKMSRKLREINVFLHFVFEKEHLRVGTRKAMPVNLPFNSGITLPTAWKKVNQNVNKQLTLPKM